MITTKEIREDKKEEIKEKEEDLDKLEDHKEIKEIPYQQIEISIDKIETIEEEVKEEYEPKIKQ